MIRLTTLDRAKSWLNVFHDQDDEKLDFMIQAASQAVLNYLDLDESVFIDSDGGMDVPEVEEAATIILVQKLYDGQDEKILEYGRLPIEVTSLLYIRRRGMGIA